MPKNAGLGDALKKVTAAPTTAPAPEAVHDDHRPPAAAAGSPSPSTSTPPPIGNCACSR